MAKKAKGGRGRKPGAGLNPGIKSRGGRGIFDPGPSLGGKGQSSGRARAGRKSGGKG